MTKKKLTTLLSVALSLTSATTLAQAPAKVTSLNVQGTTATFTLNAEKTHTLPACINGDTRQLWSLDITSIQGRALYSLLLTAVSKSQLVVAQSANNCDVLAGIEQVAGLNVSFNDAQPAGSSTVGLYKGDGVTKVGDVITVENGYVTYHDKANNWFAQFTRRNSNSPVYYLDAQCQGQPYGLSGTWSDSHNQGPTYSTILNAFLLASPSWETSNRLNIYGGNKVYAHLEDGSCVENGVSYEKDASYTKLSETTHPMCGDKQCVIK
ncbi:hypothetical protein [Pseudoalteromonas sp. McH1-42]|uniref:hypothetical protein n=1 Tax=Pseudoalteromonas sp. McH1-42 TaxID=2917752 RepID=UPI001EF51AD4|nr:hypothetical protein [Pseudoalteromonas sp. McH1-42]MCG7560709.1 hypothetical protein [Pseudoalteromonas sp. McH1-42]